MPEELVVVGAGPAGLSCATVAAEAGRSVTVLDRGTLGGELFNVDIVRDLPGVDGEVAGHELASRLLEQADTAGVVLDIASVETIRPIDAGGWLVDVHSGEHRAAQVVVATGSGPLVPASLGDLEHLEGRGLAHCAVCDGPLYAGLGVAVVGEDDIALAEVEVLARHAAAVHLLAPGDLDHVTGGWRRTVLDHETVQVHPHAKLSEVLADEQVLGVRFADGAGTHDLEVGGVFFALGRVPASAPAVRVLETDALGGLVGRPEQGLHVAGDVRSGSSITVAGALADGVAAARAMLTSPQGA